jgi:hypothetical protein
MGRPKKEDSEVRRNLSKRWYNLMARCNNPEHPRYSQYGGAGVTVCDRWLERENFIQDAVQLPGYERNSLLSGQLHLDKDIESSGKKLYSPETCVFTDIATNNKHKPNQMNAFKAISPDGVEHIVTNQSEFAKEQNLRQSTISDCLVGRVKRHRGWTFEK